MSDNKEEVAKSEEVKNESPVQADEKKNDLEAVLEAVIDAVLDESAEVKTESVAESVAEFIEALDTNNDGKIDEAEFKAGIEAGLADVADDGNAETSKAEQIAKTFDDLDTNNDGQVDAAELIAAVTEGSAEIVAEAAQEALAESSEVPEAAPEVSESVSESVAEVIEILDANNDGVIDKEEFQSGLAEALGENATADEISNAFDAIDTNNDGKIDVDELVAAVTAEAEQQKAESSEAPEAPVDGSEQNDLESVLTAPAESSEEREASSEVPEVSAEVPEVSAEAPEVSAEALEVSAEVPEAAPEFSETVAEVIEIFDANNDGVIDKEEFQSGLAEVLGENATAEEISNAFDAIDTNNDGKIDADELVVAVTAEAEQQTAESSEAPEAPVDGSEQNDLESVLTAPAESSEAPDVSSEAPDVSSEVPEVSAEAPAESSEVPEAAPEVSESVSESVAEVIEILDANNDGVIDKEEFQSGLAEALGENATADEISNAFDAIDTNNDGKIDVDELVAAVAAEAEQQKAESSEAPEVSESVAEVIEILDANNDGVIDKEEFQAGLAEVLGENASSEEISNAFDAIDTNNDGKIDADELVAAVEAERASDVELVQESSEAPNEEQHSVELSEAPADGSVQHDLESVLTAPVEEQQSAESSELQSDGAVEEQGVVPEASAAPEDVQAEDELAPVPACVLRRCPDFEPQVEIEQEEVLVLNEAVENLPPAEEESQVDLAVALTAAVGVLALGVEEAVQNEVRTKYCAEFGITEKAYDLVEEFYNEHQNDQLISNGLLRKLIVECTKDRSEVTASSDDVERALASVDSDKDDKINFDEFLQLLSLFFASKNNLQKRIEAVLVNQASSHANLGQLSSAEATQFKHFLDTFYGHSGDEQVKESFLSKVLGKIFKSGGDEEDKSKVDVDYKEFASQAAAHLEDSTFVKFE